MEYFNENYLRKNKSMYICNSLIKHGYFNFSLTILEYCSPDKCLEREGYYLKLLKPEYNIAQDPVAPFSGRKHSDKSKQIISDTAKKSDNSGRYKTGQERPEGSGRPYKQIEVFDIKNNTTTSYDSMCEASRALNISFTRRAAISIYFIRNQKKAL